jgi:hypothetical protein
MRDTCSALFIRIGLNIITVLNITALVIQRSEYDSEVICNAELKLELKLTFHFKRITPNIYFCNNELITLFTYKYDV